MITFHIITIFPDILDSYLNESILARAQKSKLIKIKIYDLRKFTKNKHKKVDDKPYGGGPGMVMQIEPIARAVKSIESKISSRGGQKTNLILFSPAGKQFTQKMAINYAKKERDIILLAGRYEGFDARLKKLARDMGLGVEEISIGPFVLTGGELPAMILIDSISRQIKGVLGSGDSLEEGRGLGIPVYTRPEIFKYGGKEYKAPKILLSGDHRKIAQWRARRAKNTKI